MGTIRSKKAYDFDAIREKNLNVYSIIWKWSRKNVPNVITSFTFGFIILLDGRNWIFWGKMCTIDLLLKQHYFECVAVGVFFVTCMDYIHGIYFMCLNRTIECQTWVFHLAFDALLVIVVAIAVAAFFLLLFWMNIIGNSWWLPIWRKCHRPLHTRHTHTHKLIFSIFIHSDLLAFINICA